MDLACLASNVDPNPRQLLSPSRQLVALPHELFLRFEQLEPRCGPFARVPVLCFVIAPVSMGLPFRL
jgi:hypothetical protein